MRDLEDVLNSHDLLILLLIELPTTQGRRASCEWVHYKSSRFSATCRARRNSRSSANTWDRKTRGPRGVQGGVREGGPTTNTLTEQREDWWRMSFAETGQFCRSPPCLSGFAETTVCVYLWPGPRDVSKWPRFSTSTHDELQCYTRLRLHPHADRTTATRFKDSANWHKMFKSEWEKMWGKENERKKSCVGSDR